MIVAFVLGLWVLFCLGIGWLVIREPSPPVQPPLPKCPDVIPEWMMTS